MRQVKGKCLASVTNDRVLQSGCFAACQLHAETRVPVWRRQGTIGFPVKACMTGQRGKGKGVIAFDVGKLTSGWPAPGARILTRPSLVTVRSALTRCDPLAATRSPAVFFAPPEPLPSIPGNPSPAVTALDQPFCGCLFAAMKSAAMAVSESSCPLRGRPSAAATEPAAICHQSTVQCHFQQYVECALFSSTKCSIANLQMSR